MKRWMDPSKKDEIIRIMNVTRKTKMKVRRQKECHNITVEYVANVLVTAVRRIV